VAKIKKTFKNVEQKTLDLVYSTSYLMHNAIAYMQYSWN